MRNDSDAHERLRLLFEQPQAPGCLIQETLAMASNPKILAHARTRFMLANLGGGLLAGHGYCLNREQTTAAVLLVCMDPERAVKVERPGRPWGLIEDIADVLAAGERGLTLDKVHTRLLRRAIQRLTGEAQCVLERKRQEAFPDVAVCELAYSEAIIDRLSADLSECSAATIQTLGSQLSGAWNAYPI